MRGETIFEPATEASNSFSIFTKKCFGLVCFSCGTEACTLSLLDKYIDMLHSKENINGSY